MAVVNQQNTSFPTVKWLVRSSFTLFMHCMSLKQPCGEHLFFFSLFNISAECRVFFFPRKTHFRNESILQESINFWLPFKPLPSNHFPLYAIPTRSRWFSHPPVSMKITLHHVVDGMPCLVRQTRKAGGGGLNIIAAVVCSLHSQREHNSSITRLLLPGHSMSACLPSSCAPLSSQAERMINYTKLLHADWILLFMLCIYIYIYIYKKIRTGEKALEGAGECLWIRHIC